MKNMLNTLSFEKLEETASKKRKRGFLKLNFSLNLQASKKFFILFLFKLETSDPDVMVEVNSKLIIEIHRKKY